MNKIFVVMHKEAKVPDSKLYTPIVVGNKAFDIPNGYYRDDINDNIADKNSSFCELTALFWMWKNAKNIDNIGLCHYRRYLMKKTKIDFDELLENENIEKSLIKYDIILPQKRHFLRKTVEEQYYSQDNAFKKDYEMLRKVISERQPDYIDAFEKVSKGHSTYLYNMFVMKNEMFNDYCEWLFDILFEMEKRIDISNYTVQQKRIFGFLSERLMTVYVQKHDLKVKEYKVINISNDLRKEKKVILKNNIKKIFNKLRGE